MPSRTAKLTPKTHLVADEVRRQYGIPKITLIERAVVAFSQLPVEKQREIVMPTKVLTPAGSNAPG